MFQPNFQKQLPVLPYLLYLRNILLVLASDVRSDEEKEETEPDQSAESMRVGVRLAMEKGEQEESWKDKSGKDLGLKEKVGLGMEASDGYGDESGEKMWQEKLKKARRRLEEKGLFSDDKLQKKKDGGLTEGSVAGDGEGKGHVSKQLMATQRREKRMESWEETLKGDLVKKGTKLEKKEEEAKLKKKKTELEKQEKSKLEKQEKSRLEKSKLKNKKEVGTNIDQGSLSSTVSKEASNVRSLGENWDKKEAEKPSGEGNGASLEEKKSVDEKKGQRSGEEENCGGEKMTASGEEMMKADLRRLEQIATFKGVLLSKGISKVAVSGLTKTEKEKCPLLFSLLGLLAEVRSAGLLFIKCSENGVAYTTPNFYLGRAYGLTVVNASFLLDWEENQELPNLDNYLVVGSYLKGGELVPLTPIKEPLMIGKVFRLCSFKGKKVSVDLIRELIIRMGGRIVDEDCADDKAFNIGSEFIQGKEMFRPDWILDTVEQGKVLAKKRFVVEFHKEVDEEGIYSQVCKIKLDNIHQLKSSLQAIKRSSSLLETVVDQEQVPGGRGSDDYGSWDYNNMRRDRNKILRRSENGENVKSVGSGFHCQAYGDKALWGIGGENYGGNNFSRAPNFGGPDLWGSNLEGQNFGGQNFGGQNFGGQNFGGQHFGGPNFGGPNFESLHYGGPIFGSPNVGGPGRFLTGGSNFGGANSDASRNAGYAFWNNRKFNYEGNFSSAQGFIEFQKTASGDNGWGDGQLEGFRNGHD